MSHNKALKPLRNKTHSSDEQKAARRLTMRYGKQIMKNLLLIILFIFSQISYANCPPVSKEMESLIKEHASKVAGGEYCKYRKTYNKTDIELSLYTIEGPCYNNKGPAGSCGNHYFISMVGIINQVNFPHIVVGGKGVFHPKSIKYINDIIEVEGLTYSKSDPMCCPSINETRYFKPNGNKFEKTLQP